MTTAQYREGHAAGMARVLAAKEVRIEPWWDEDYRDGYRLGTLKALGRDVQVSTETVTFALCTYDAAWIARNHGTTDEAGRVLVQVPAAEVEKITSCGRPFLMHTFADVPADATNATIRCLAAWVEDAEVTAQRPEALSGKALFLAMASRKA